MKTLYRVAVVLIWIGCPLRVHACEPVLPFIQTVAPAATLSGSFLMLLLAVLVKAALFAFFEKRLPRLHAAWRMVVGNLLTTVVGVIVAVMIGSGVGVWTIGLPLVLALCWLPSRRLVGVAPQRWLARTSPSGVAGIMTLALLASCMLFMIGQGAIHAGNLIAYWIIKLVAISLALLVSITLTTVWEEWVIWRLSSRPEHVHYFPSALRANLYVLVLIMAVPAVIILPKRLKSPDFLAKRIPIQTTQTTGGNVR